MRPTVESRPHSALTSEARFVPWWHSLGVLLGLIVLGLGCSPEQRNIGAREARIAGTDANEAGSQILLLEMFSWWTAPGEAEAFQSLVDAHKARYPDARLFNAAAASGMKAKEILKQRLAHNELPDLIQENAHDLRTSVLQNSGKLLPLDSMFDELGLKQVVFPEVLADITVAGHIYSMPVNLHRENTLIYNKKLFLQHNLAVPRNLVEFRKVCEALRKKGVTPVATSHQGWILRIMFNSIAAAHMGPTPYYNYMMNKIAPEDTGLRESIRFLREILVNYANSDAGEDGFGWTNAAQAVMSGDAAMYFHGDWAKGYLVQLGAMPGVDIGVASAPGTQGLFLYDIDVFAIPLHAPNEAGAKAFLSTIASGSAQTVFNRIKGSSPIRTDLPATQMDRCAQETMQDLQTATVRMPLRIGDGWDEAFGHFAKNRDEEALYQVLVANRPVW